MPGFAGSGVATERKVNPRKLEHGFRMICARIPSTSPSGHEDNDVPTFRLLLQTPELAVFLWRSFS